MNILHIDSSILGANSVSRGLSTAITEKQAALHPGVVYMSTRRLLADSAGRYSEYLPAASGQLVQRDLAMLGADLAAGLTVQVVAVRRLGHRDQVGGAAGVAPEEGCQRLLGESTRRAALDVELDAQLDGLDRPGEQRGKQLLELLRTVGG